MIQQESYLKVADNTGAMSSLPLSGRRPPAAP